MTTIEDQIYKEIDAADAADPQRNIKHFRDRLLNEITSRQRLDQRQGIVVDKFGRQVNLKETVLTAIDSAYYIGRASNAEEKARWVSKWPKPTKEQRQKIAREVREVIDNLVQLNSVVAKDKGALQRAVNVLSENLVYSHDDAGNVVFSKLNPSGIPGSVPYSFDDIIPKDLIDYEQTQLEREIKDAVYRRNALAIIDIKDPRKELIKEKIEQLKRKDLIEKIPRRSIPQIPKSELENEFYRKEAVLRGLDPATQGGQAAHVLRMSAKQEMEKLDDLTDVQRQLNEIKPQTTQAWEGLPE